MSPQTSTSSSASAVRESHHDVAHATELPSGLPPPYRQNAAALSLARLLCPIAAFGADLAGRLTSGSAGADPALVGVQVQLEALDHLEREATAQQRAFRRELTIANLCLMIAGVLSGLVLALPGMMSDIPAAGPGQIDWTIGCHV